MRKNVASRSVFGLLLISILVSLFSFGEIIVDAKNFTALNESFKKQGFINGKNYPTFAFSEKKTAQPNAKISATKESDGKTYLKILNYQDNRKLSYTTKMDTATEGYADAVVQFDIKGGKIVQKTKASIHALGVDKKNISFNIVLENGTINVSNGGVLVPLLPSEAYKETEWYSIKITLNMKDKTYDVYLNNSETPDVEKAAFVDSASMGNAGDGDDFSQFKIQTNGIEGEENSFFGITNIDVQLIGNDFKLVSGKDVVIPKETFFQKGEYESALTKSQELYNNRPQKLRQMENLTRSPIALNAQDGGVFISWRLLGTDPQKTVFDIFKDGNKLNESPIIGATNFVDKSGTADNKYVIKAILDEKIVDETTPISVLATPYYTIPVGAKEGYHLNEMSVGDLDGDGEYEIVILRLPDKFGSKEIPTITKFPLFDAYEMDGTPLWSVDLGPNIVEFVDMNFLVYDFDGDGKAEFVTKTAEGTKDGTGVTIGDIDNDGKTDYRDSLVYNTNRQYLSNGPEFISVFDGLTGKELTRTNYIDREPINQWGGKNVMENAHRASHPLFTPAYLDGVHPSFVVTRGCWNTIKLKAFDYKDGKLIELWYHDGNVDKEFNGQANHQIEVADVDYDGLDEIIWGSAVFDHDGTPMYKYNGYGHGDAMHVGKFMPDYPDLFQVASVHEGKVPDGLHFREARTGETIFGFPNSEDTGRGVIGDIDPRFDGPVVWAAGGTGSFVYDKGKWQVWDGPSIPMNFMIWWDGDLLREFSNNVTISKFNPNTNKVDELISDKECHYVNGTKQTPALQADIFGDWREEYILSTKAGDAFRVYSTNIPTTHRIYTLMHDPVYRMGTAWQNNHYAQPPHTGFYIGHKMTNIPIPEMFVMKNGVKVTNPDLDGKTVSTAKYAINSVESSIKPTEQVCLQIDNSKALVGDAQVQIDSQNAEVKPVVVDGRTLLPVRFLSEVFGAKVDWDSATKTVTITGNSKAIKIVLDSSKYTINGEEKTFDVPAQVINGRTMVPLRAIVEALNKQVFWNNANKLIIISNQTQEVDENAVNSIISKIK